jgi:hypothetical protein
VLFNMLTYPEFKILFLENITCGHQVTLQHIKQDNDKKLKLNTCNKPHQSNSNKTLVATRPNPTRPWWPPSQFQQDPNGHQANSHKTLATTRPIQQDPSGH